MGKVESDRNLLFGILALQMDFIVRDDLIAGMNAWVLDKEKTLGQILVAQGVLDPRDHALLEPMIARHVAIHGGDPAASLAALGSGTAVRPGLEAVPDRDVQASVAQLGTARNADDPDRTTTYVGKATAEAGRFRILRLHDRGALGEVYVARDEELHREVALKQIQEQHADDSQRRARFLVEAEITGGLEHPGIVPVYGLGQYENGRPFYAMRFIRGDNLKHAIERFHEADRAPRDPGERALELRRLLGRFLDVCNAIAYAHSRGVLHRDLKPGNIMLGKFGETLVVDWGLAKLLGAGRSAPPRLDGEQTFTPSSGSEVKSTEMGTRVGTPAYMSPEQAAGRIAELGAASDVYSLGATLFCLLTGKPPLTERDPVELFRKLEQGDYPAPRALNPQVDRRLDAICRKAMALRPEDRYATPRALADDIEHWLADEPVAAAPESWPARLARTIRRHRTWAQAAAAALVLVTMVAVGAALVVNQARGLAERRRVEAVRDRGLAERRRLEADEQHRIADQKRAEADAQRLVAERNLARLALDNGLNLCAQGDTHSGLLWLARALQIAPADAGDLQHAIRANLDAWGRTFHRPLSCLPSGEVSALAFDPDGTTLITSTAAGTVRQWDVTTGNPRDSALAALAGQSVLAVFSPDGQRLATLSAAGGYGRPIESAQLWDVATGRRLGSPLRHQGAVRALNFSPDGRLLATTGQDGTVRLWNAARGDAVAAPMRHGELVTALAFSPDGKRLATATPGGGVRLWSTETGRSTGAAMPHEGIVRSLAFRPDGKRLATGSSGGTARLWDATTGQPVGPPLAHGGSDPVDILAFLPDGKRLITASQTEPARIWDLTTEGPARPPRPIKGIVRNPAFRPDGKVFTATDTEGTLRLWDAETGTPLGDALYQNERGAILAVFSPDGRCLATASSSSSSARLWDAATGRALGTPINQDDGILALAFRDAGKTLAVATKDDAQARLWDVTTRRPVGNPVEHQDTAGLRLAVLSPDGRRVATASANGAVSLLDRATGRPITPPLPLREHVRAMAFAADGTTLATATATEGVRLWDAETGRPRGKPMKVAAEPVGALAFSPDGKILATASGMIASTSQARNTVRLWDTATCSTLNPLLQHERGVLCVAFSPDGKLIAAAAADKTVRLWEVPTGRALLTPMVHAQAVRSMAFSPDGTQLATAGEKTVRLWETATGLPAGAPLVHPTNITALAFSTSGRVLATACSSPSFEGVVRLWETAIVRPPGTGVLRGAGANSKAVFRPDGRILATVNFDGTVGIRDGHTGLPLGPPLRAGDTGLPLGAPLGGGDKAVDLAFRADGKRLVTVNAEGQVHLWDGDTGRPVETLDRGESTVLDSVLSPDGKQLCTVLNVSRAGFTEGKLLFWPPGPGRRYSMVDSLSHPGGILAMALSRDGNRLATTGADLTTRVLDGPETTESGPPLIPPIAQEGLVHALAFSPDARVLATAGDSGVRFWNASTGKAFGASIPQARQVRLVAFAPNRRFIATAGADRIVRFWDTATGKAIGEPMLHQDEVRALSFRGSGSALVTVTGDGTSQVWHTFTGHPRGAPRSAGAGVEAVALSADGTLLATAADQLVRLWSMEKGRAFGTPIPLTADARSLAFSADGKVLAIVAADRTARLWDSATGSPIGALMRPPVTSRLVELSPDGTIFAWSRGAKLQLEDVATGRPIGAPLPSPNFRVLEFSPDGRMLATAAFSPTGPGGQGGFIPGEAHLWEANTGRPLAAPMQFEGFIGLLTFSPDGKILATASGRSGLVYSLVNSARLWDTATGRALSGSLQHAGKILGMAFSPDSRCFATASEDHTARLWDAATGKPLGPPLPHADGVDAVAFSPKGRILATASVYGTVRFWDGATSRPIGVPIPFGGRLTRLVFHPGGELLLSQYGGSMALWNVPAPVTGTPDQLIRWAQYLTTMELDASDAAGMLNPYDWEQRRNESETYGLSVGLMREENESAAAWHEKQAVAAERQARWFAARFHLDRLIADRPEDASLRTRRARALSALGLWVEAESDFSKAIALGAGEAEPSLFTQRGDLRARLGRWAEADADFATACARGGDVNAFYDHALLTLDQGDVDGFRATCAAMLERFARPETASVARWIALACATAPEAIGDPDRAVRVAYRGLALLPEDPWSLELLAAVLYRAGRYEEALTRLDQAVERNPKRPNPPVADLIRALAHHRLGQREEARKRLGSALLSLDPILTQGSATSSLTWAWRMTYRLLRREAELEIRESRPLYLPANVFQE
jgi:WD40 repeat protein/tetratricopeptide (TPR) repeat protein/tRNA A-37 threonylcarbamoyl transferase component Bud32